MKRLSLIAIITALFLTPVVGLADESELPEARQLAYWNAEHWRGSPLSDRIQDSAATEVIDFLRQENAANGFEEIPRQTASSSAFSTYLKGVIASPENDDRSHATQYILLHEVAHVLAAVDGTIHPRWDQALPDARVLETKYPFTALSWIIEDGEYRRRLDNAGQEPERIRYYAAPDDQISINRAAEIYEKYLAADIPTLYGATNPYEDFAESFVNYVHTVLLGQPYELTIDAEGMVTTYEACWRQPRCQTKRRVLEAWLQQRDVLTR